MINRVKKNVPFLRFSEFQGAWKKDKLGNISTWASGGTPSKKDDSYWDGDIPWISASSMRGIEYSNSKLKITKEGLEKGSKLALKNTLLLLVRGSMLFKKIPIGITIRDVAFNQDVKSISTTESTNIKFLLYWFMFSENQLLNMVVGTGIGAGKLDTQDLKGMPILTPSLPEQKKIANFLTTIDTKIQQLTKKKILLETYKKGVMQQIFSQEIRFKNEEGKNFSDWEEKRLVEIVDIKTGNRDTQDKEEGGIYPFFVRSNTVEKINSFAYDGEAILTSGDGVGVGKNFHYIVGKFNYHQRVYNIHNFKKEVNGKFIFFYFSKFFYRRVIRMSAKNSVDSVRKNMISEMKIPIPIEKEQKKIANFLTALDDKIQQTGEQLAQVQAYKKGLLQQMFV